MPLPDMSGSPRPVSWASGIGLLLLGAWFAFLAFGGLSLLRSGSTIEGSTTLFWVSIVLAVAAIVLAAAAIVLSRRRR